MSPIALGKGPRNSPLKTRTVKKELASTSKRNPLDRESFAPVPLSRFKLSSIATLPLATIIFSRVPVLPPGPVWLGLVNKLPEPLLKRKSNGSKATEIVFSIGSPSSHSGFTK
ncbi:MAG TPA: hypothetical protein VGC91_14430 [Pyrinomonadaceae bacterium]